MLRRLKPDPAIATHSLTLLKAKQIFAPHRRNGWSPIGHRFYRPGRVFVALGSLAVVHSPMPAATYMFSVQPWDLRMYFQVLREGFKLSNPFVQIEIPS